MTFREAIPSDIKTNSITKKSAFGITDFIMLFMLVIQTLYLIWFFSDIHNSRTFVILNCLGAAIILLFVTSLISFVAYWIGFFRHKARERILLALLLIFHFGVAYCSFALTIITAISRS
jgi:hypothetical protein